MERWHLDCEHTGPDGVDKQGIWFADQASMVIALLDEMLTGYYTSFTIHKGAGPARPQHAARQAAVRGWYQRTFEEPA